MTTAEALRDAQARLSAAGIGDARLEAEVLLSHALQLSRSTLLARLRETLIPDGRAASEALLSRRLNHELTAYIIGCKEFYELELACTTGALIPRPETELLVEYALGQLRGPLRADARVEQKAVLGQGEPASWQVRSNWRARIATARTAVASCPSRPSPRPSDIAGSS